MIIVRMMGGLGNQLFQYAAGRAIALRRRAPLKLDCSFYESQSKRAYQLHQFNVVERFPSRLDRFVLDPPGRRGAGRLARILRRCWPSLDVTRVVENGYAFDNSVIERPGSLYLDGYWQSESYFAEIAPLLKREFTMRKPPDRENAEMIKVIDACNSVCLHVRRTDYVSDPSTNAFHGTCGVDYYERAVSSLAERVTDPVFFVFSDDPEWTAKHIAIPQRVRHVTHNVGGQDHEDLRLMTYCKHFIIANSTFSWWGAWLAQNADKIVICPERWFSDPNIPTGDLIPSNWVRIW